MTLGILQFNFMYKYRNAFKNDSKARQAVKLCTNTTFSTVKSVLLDQFGHSQKVIRYLWEVDA